VLRICCKTVLVVALVLTGSHALAAGASAHRGDTKNAPENTIPAIESAVRNGAHQIEIDVKLSKDGKLVIMHDWTVDRTTNGAGKVADLTFDELRALDAGSAFSPDFKGTKIPTLEEVLDVIPHSILVNVHVHNDPEIAVPVVKFLSKMNRLDHCFLTLGTIADDARAAARAAVPDIKLCKGHPASEKVTRKTFTIPDEVVKQYQKLYPGSRIDSHIEYIQLVGGTIDEIREAAAALRQYGVRINYCCASTEESIRPLADTEVEFILTDNLELCLEILDESGVKPISATGKQK
jgi:glycerophosphoryl diester phosphodiesterase